MFEAITYKDMLQSIKENGIKADTIGILLARPKSNTGESILKSLPYYHHRSGELINFFLPGYGAYWYGTYPDEIDAVKIDGTQWSFSNEMFAKFVSDLEKKSSWQYSGESELLLIDCHDSKLDFSNVLRLQLDAMLRDDVVPSIEWFFERLFREMGRQSKVTRISNIAGAKTLGQVTIDSVMEIIPNIFGDIIKKEKHYITRDYSK